MSESLELMWWGRETSSQAQIDTVVVGHEQLHSD